MPHSERETNLWSEGSGWLVDHRRHTGLRVRHAGLRVRHARLRMRRRRHPSSRHAGHALHALE